jgi:hypothetical protein
MPNFGVVTYLDRPMDDKPHKSHHASQSGVKAEKKSKGKGKADHGKGYNEKVGILSMIVLFTYSMQAFAPKSGRNADRQGRRAAEKDQTRLHVPLVDRTPDDEPPPVIVAVVGPAGVSAPALPKSNHLSDVLGRKNDARQEPGQTVHETHFVRGQRPYYGRRR